MKKILYHPALIIVLAGLISIALFLIAQNKRVNLNPNPPPVNTADYKNLAYVIEGVSVRLENGHAEQESAPGSASKIITDYFGNEAFGDINADGMEDVAFLLTQQSGGSGTFFYVAAALKTSDGYQPTNTVLLGDRISSQSNQIEQGIVVVNYVDRRDGEPMTTQPSVAVSKYLKIENGVLTERTFNPTFGMPWEIRGEETVQFVDGLTIVLIRVVDSRCKEGVICVWAGELSPQFGISGGKVSNYTEFTMGTAIKKSVTLEGYNFTLQEATETSATIIVTKESQSTGSCYIGGCSSQICSDQKDVITTCEWTEGYACYQTAACERQTNGQCGWTQTSELMTCLNNK